MGAVQRLDNDKRKAIRQLVHLGFAVEDRGGDYKVTSPEGVPVGCFALAGKHARVTPESLQARYREWMQKRGRFAPKSPTDHARPV